MEQFEPFEECERCFKKVSIYKMVVKETQDGNCIYCPECTEYHKFLEKEFRRVCKEYSLNYRE